MQNPEENAFNPEYILRKKEAFITLPRCNVPPNTTMLVFATSVKELISTKISREITHLRLCEETH